MWTRLAVWTVIPVSLMGCRAEFDVARGELGPFRIAAMGLEEGDDCPTAAAAIWSGEGLFHRESPRLVWSMDGVELGQGWAVPVCESGLLELTASNSAGEIRYGQLSVSVSTGLITVNRSAVDLPDLELEARREASGQEVHSVVPCLLYTSPSPRDGLLSRMPSSA